MLLLFAPRRSHEKTAYLILKESESQILRRNDSLGIARLPPEPREEVCARCRI